QRRDVGLLLNGEVPGPLQVAPYAIPAVSKATWVCRLGGNDQLCCKGVAPIRLPGERPQAFADTDLMQQWVGLVQVIADAVVEVATVVVASPEVEEMHRFSPFRSPTPAPAGRAAAGCVAA